MAPAADPDALLYLRATFQDREVIITLMTELVHELDPSPQGQRIIDLLPQDTDRALNSPRIALFLAWDNGVPVGLSRADILLEDPIFRLRDQPHCGYIDQMYVRHRYRDSKVGERLLGACEAWLRQEGMGHVLLHAAPKAVRFYARCGYQPNREMFKELS